MGKQSLLPFLPCATKMQQKFCWISWCRRTRSLPDKPQKMKNPNYIILLEAWKPLSFTEQKEYH